jgi:hypothetical protein
MSGKSPQSGRSAWAGAVAAKMPATIGKAASLIGHAPWWLVATIDHAIDPGPG